MKPTKPVLRRPSFANLVARLLKQRQFCFDKDVAIINGAGKPFSVSINNGAWHCGETPSEAIEAALQDAEGKS